MHLFVCIGIDFEIGFDDEELFWVGGEAFPALQEVGQEQTDYEFRVVIILLLFRYEAQLMQIWSDVEESFVVFEVLWKLDFVVGWFGFS